MTTGVFEAAGDAGAVEVGGDGEGGKAVVVDDRFGVGVAVTTEAEGKGGAGDSVDETTGTG